MMTAQQCEAIIPLVILVSSVSLHVTVVSFNGHNVIPLLSFLSFFLYSSGDESYWNHTGLTLVNIYQSTIIIKYALLIYYADLLRCPFFNSWVKANP